MPRNNLLAGALILSLLLVAGCHKSEKPAINAKTAATVNGQAIYDQTIQAEMAKIGAVPESQAQQMADQVLKSAIDQELLAQEAEKSKLADSAEVQSQLAQARRAILAQAQLEAMTAGMAAPTEAEVKAYFDAHPEQFSQRKVYRLVNLVIDATPENLDKIHSIMAGAANVNAMVAGLRQAGIQVGGQQMQKGAEELPTDMVAKLNAMKNGQSLTFERGGRLNVVLLQDARSEPVTLEQVGPAINAYLMNENKRKKIDDGLNKIRGQAKIEYTAPYSAPASEKPMESGKPAETAK